MNAADMESQAQISTTCASTVSACGFADGAGQIGATPRVASAA